MRLVVVFIATLLLVGCAQQVTQEPVTEPIVQIEQEQPAAEEEQVLDQQEAASEPNQTAEHVEKCVSELEPHQIRQIKVTLFETGLRKTEEGLSFRVLPMDESGTEIIPTEGTITVGVYSSNEEDPLKREFLLYKRSYPVKEEEVMPDCGPKPVTVLWEAIKSHKNYRYVKLPNHGIVEIQFTRTGSDQLWETEYRAAEFDEYIIE